MHNKTRPTMTHRMTDVWLFTSSPTNLLSTLIRGLIEEHLDRILQRIKKQPLLADWQANVHIGRSGGDGIMKGAVRRKPAESMEGEKSTGRHPQVIWQWYSIKRRKLNILPLKEFYNSIMQMKTSIDGCRRRGGRVSLRGILNSFMSKERPPFVPGRK